MSSHREAPEISKDPVADSADLYAFVCPDSPNNVAIIANYVPLQQPAGGPNFYEFGDDVLYEIHIDNDGDAQADITYQFRFDTVLTDTGANDLFLYNTGQIKHLSDKTWNRKQFYSVTRVDKHGTHLLAKDLACPPCNVGTNSIPHYAPLTAEALHPLGAGSVFAGQRADGFYVDLGSIFDLGDLRPFQPDFLLKGAAVAGINTLAGLNVHSIAIQVPIRDLTRDGIEADRLQGLRLDHRRLDDREPPEVEDPRRRLTPGRGRRSRASATRSSTKSSSRWARRTTGTPRPRTDDSAFAHYYDHPTLASLLNVLYPGAFPHLAAYSAKASNTRPDLDAVLLTGVPPLFPGFQNYTGATKADMLRLNVAIKPTSRRPRRTSSVSSVATTPDSRTGAASSTTSSASSSRPWPGRSSATSSRRSSRTVLPARSSTSAPPEPTTVASLPAFGLSYRRFVPVPGDPWDGFDNPSTQNIPVAG